MVGLIPWRKQNETRSNTLRPFTGHPLWSWQRDFDTLWDRVWGDLMPMDRWNGSELGLHWGFDVQESEREYLVRIEAPGFEADELDVQIRNGQLELKAEHREDQGQSSSYRYGQLYRSLPLPDGVNEDAVSARYRNGVLEVHLPKSEQAQGRRIEVRAS